uniref:Elongator complex protein 2 n=1 Tax=Rhodotorula toruloides TaxID=5286 RepID=A0A0K3CCY1_RHOTO
MSGTGSVGAAGRSEAEQQAQEPSAAQLEAHQTALVALGWAAVTDEQVKASWRQQQAILQANKTTNEERWIRIEEKKDQERAAKERKEGGRQGPIWSEAGTDAEREEIASTSDDTIPQHLYERIIKGQPLPIYYLRTTHLTQTYKDDTNALTKRIRQVERPLSREDDYKMAENLGEHISCLNKFSKMVSDLASTPGSKITTDGAQMIKNYVSLVMTRHADCDTDEKKLELLLYDIGQRRLLTKEEGSGKRINIAKEDLKALDEARAERRDMAMAYGNGLPNVYDYLPTSSTAMPQLIRSTRTKRPSVDSHPIAQRTPSARFTPYQKGDGGKKVGNYGEGGSGHSFRVCYGCGKKGHSARTCRNVDAKCDGASISVEGTRYCFAYQSVQCGGDICTNGTHACSIYRCSEPDWYGFFDVGLREGFYLGIDPSKAELKESKILPPEQQKGPERLSLDFRELTMGYLTAEKKAGRVFGPYSKEETERMLGGPFQCSPFGIVERLGKAPRFVRNFSYPYASTPNADYLSVNRRIDDYDPRPSTYWGGPREFAAVVVGVPNDTVALIDDAKDAFRQVPIHPDDRKWLVMQFDGKFFIDSCLPMGLSPATDIWGRTVDLLRLGAESRLKKTFCDNGGDLHALRNWVDDLALLASLGRLSPAEATALADEYYDTFGLVLAKAKKRKMWSSIAVFQGLEFDLQNKILSLPNAKRLKALRKIDAFLQLSWITATAISELCGTLTHLAFVITEGRFFLSPLYIFETPFLARPYLKRVPDDDLLKAVRWWREALTLSDDEETTLRDSDLLPSRFSRPLRPNALSIELSLYTDASDSGVGVVVNGSQAFWPLKPSWRDGNVNIDVPEAFAVELLVRMIVDANGALSNRLLQIYCDNETVVRSWRKNRCRNLHINACLLRIYRLLAMHDWRLELEYVPSEMNEADAVSRGGDNQLLELLKRRNGTSTTKSDEDGLGQPGEWTRKEAEWCLSDALLRSADHPHPTATLPNPRKGRLNLSSSAPFHFANAHELGTDLQATTTSAAKGCYPPSLRQTAPLPGASPSTLPYAALSDLLANSQGHVFPSRYNAIAINQKAITAAQRPFFHPYPPNLTVPVLSESHRYSAASCQAQINLLGAAPKAMNKRWGSALKSYHGYCSMEGISDYDRFPITTSRLRMYLGFQLGFFKADSVKKRITNLRSYCHAYQIPWKVKEQELEPLFSIIRVHEPHPHLQRQPLLSARQRDHPSRLSFDPGFEDPYHLAMLSALVIGFGSLLRSGEFTTNSSIPTDEEQAKRAKRKHLKEIVGQDTLTLHLPWDKTHHWEGADVAIVTFDLPTNMIVRQHLQKNISSPEDPLFSYVAKKGRHRGKRVTLGKQSFVNWMNKMLEATKQAPLTGHSIRIGGATQLLLNGVDPRKVQNMGRWKTIEAFQKYWRHIHVLIESGQIKDSRNVPDIWVHLVTLTGHAGSISALDVFELDLDGHKTYLIVTGGSDAMLRVWTVSQSGEANLRQTVELKGKIPLELAVTRLPSSTSLVLAVGGTETRIQLYTSRADGAELEFRRSLSLEGHTDWVRCLSFTTPIPTDVAAAPSTSTAYDIAPGEILLASGSQDNYIRLWRLSRRPDGSSMPSTATKGGDGLDALDELEEALAAAGDEELRVKAHDFSVAGDGEYSCTSEAVLLGHDAWVTGLNWAPRLSPSSPAPVQLLSASADRSMIFWEPLASGSVLPVNPSLGSHATSSTASATVWTSLRRFGEFTSSTNLGFFGALWGLDGKTVLANGWGGSWHVWKLEGAEGMEDWVPQVAVSGHLGTVKQVAWEGEGEYLLSASNDMSARLHAPWRRQANGKEIETWHELGRPQIHGYPLASVAFTSPAKRLQFVSGADEKIVRVFDAPRLWLRTLKTLSGLDLGDEEERPMAANVPPLGLSNRAIASPAEAEKLAPASSDPFEEVFPVNFAVSEHPPLEEQLLGSTLWPEVEKLYGHAFELVSVASAHSLPLVASACKATAPEHAVIRLFSTETWQPVGAVLGGHALTITKLAFSPGAENVRDRWLLSVSRDRTFRLYERDDSQSLGFYRPAGDAKPHARIVWDACWASDSSFFATASRDKTVKVWAQREASWSCAATLRFDEAATSVAATFLPGKA